MAIVEADPALDPAHELPEHSVVDLTVVEGENPSSELSGDASADYEPQHVADNALTGPDASSDYQPKHVADASADYAVGDKPESSDGSEKHELDEKFDNALYNAITKALRETPIEQMREDQEVNDKMFNIMSKALRETDFSGYGSEEEEHEASDDSVAEAVQDQVEPVRASQLDRERRGWGDKISGRRGFTEAAQPATEPEVEPEAEVKEGPERPALNAEQEFLRGRWLAKLENVPGAKKEIPKLEKEEAKWERELNEAFNSGGEVDTAKLIAGFTRARDERIAAQRALEEYKETQKEYGNSSWVEKLKDRASSKKEKTEAALNAWREQRVARATQARIDELQDEENLWKTFAMYSGMEEQDLQKVLDVKKEKSALYRTPEYRRSRENQQ